MQQSKFLFFVLFVLALFCTRVSAQPYMYVHETNATQTAYPLDSIRKLTFPAGVMQVHRNIGDTISYPFVNIRYVDFNGLTTGVSSSPNSGTGTLQVYPNPANDELYITYTSLPNESVTIEILDLQGRVLVSQQSNGAQDGMNRSMISVADLAQGTYLCRITGAQKNECIKFLKH